MEKIDIKEVKPTVEKWLKEFDSLTSAYDNKTPDKEINLKYDVDTAPQNVQYFASDVGSLPFSGKLEDYKVFFENAENYMAENKISPDNVTFDFGAYGTESGIKVKVLDDPKVTLRNYLKKIEDVHAELHDFQLALVDTRDTYINMHEEYKKVAPSPALDKAHAKLIKPYEDGIILVQGAIDQVLNKITELSPVKKKKLR